MDEIVYLPDQVTITKKENTVVIQQVGAAAPHVKIQYSADNETWADIYSVGNEYIRFSTDGGASWTSGMKFVGEDGGGAGDMTKSLYDQNADGKVDVAELAEQISLNAAKVLWLFD